MAMVHLLKKPDAATCLEPEQYLLLQTSGAPVPVYHGTFRNTAGKKVLVVEYLERIHTDEEIYGNADLSQANTASAGPIA